MATSENVEVFPFSDVRLIARLSPSTVQNDGFAYGTCSVRSGFHSAQCLVIPDPALSTRQVYLSTGVLGRLHMMETAAPFSARLKQGEVQIGPVIGILCNPRWNSSSNTLSNSTQLPALEKLLDTARGQGVTAYLFRVEDIDFQQLVTKAYIRTSRGWKTIRTPLPDAIYDQMISRKRERSTDHGKLREKLTRLYGARIFNDGFFDKWQVHEWLVNDRRMIPYVPSTIRYTRSQEASQFVRRHGTVYMKPVHGSLGLGIVRIAGMSDGSYIYEIKRPNQAPTTGRANDASDVVQSFRKRLNGRPYLLQQAIPLATMEGRPFDIRILLQRDDSGDWKRTKAFARLAKVGDITSNLSSGGEALPLSQPLERLFSNRQRRNRCKAEIQKVSRLIAEVMEQQSGKKFGELGIDLGVDQTGHVWVIEVNSKPWKSPTTENGSQEIVDLAFERPIRYAKYLAENKR